MHVPTVLMHLYPQADHVLGYRFSGDAIVEWNLPFAQPTTMELQNAWLPALKAQKVAEVRRRVVSEADAVMPVWEFIYITRSRIPDTRTTTLEAIAKKGRDMEAYINNSARTEAELLSVSWDTWV